MIIKCEANTKRIKLGSWEMHEEPKAVAVAMWWDRFCRNWVIYPVDGEGNQLEEARYGFSKAEALEIKKDLENEIMEG